MQSSTNKYIQSPLIEWRNKPFEKRTTCQISTCRVVTTQTGLIGAELLNLVEFVASVAVIALSFMTVIPDSIYRYCAGKSFNSMLIVKAYLWARSTVVSHVHMIESTLFMNFEKDRPLNPSEIDDDHYSQTITQSLLDARDSKINKTSSGIKKICIRIFFALTILISAIYPATEAILRIPGMLMALPFSLKFAKDEFLKIRLAIATLISMPLLSIPSLIVKEIGDSWTGIVIFAIPILLIAPDSIWGK